LLVVPWINERREEATPAAFLAGDAAGCRIICRPAIKNDSGADTPAHASACRVRRRLSAIVSFHSLDQPLHDNLLYIWSRITVERQIFIGRTEPSILSLPALRKGIARCAALHLDCVLASRTGGLYRFAPEKQLLTRQQHYM
jgi:hypothetical protein